MMILVHICTTVKNIQTSHHLLHLQCLLSGSVMSSSKDTQRSQRRRELDARRSKSRVRLGSCLQSWGQLKEKLGFSLHSELAQHLLERYNTVIL